jgi:membrane associated rhomboid family serine protease
MSVILNQIKSQFKSGSMNLKLMMVNLGVFVALLVSAILIKFFIADFSPLKYLGLPYDLNELLYRPWTFVTYMFSHSLNDIWHLFFNMLMLYFMGRFFESVLGGKKLLSTYLLGGLTGGLLFLLGYNFIPTISATGSGMPMVGASGAITAIFVAIGVYMPNHEIRIPFISQPFKLIHVVLVFVLLDFIRLQSSIGVQGANTGGWLAHIGGALFGFVYASQLKKGRNISKGFEKFLDSLFGFFKPGTKLKVKYPKKKKKNKKKKIETKVPRDDYDYNNNKVENQKKTDSILDKISKSGYESLSKKEKDFLFRQSKH